MRVSSPHGRSWTKPAWATSSASAICSGRRVGPPEGEVLADRHGEQRRVLERRRDHRAQRVQGQRADVVAVDRDRPGRDVVEAWQQGGQDRLAGAGGAHHGHGLARGDVEVEVAQDVVLAVGEAEPHALEPQRAARPDQLEIAVRDVGLGVEHLGDPVGRGHGLLGHRQQEPQGGDRPHQRQHQGDERDQRAQGQPALAGGERAEAEDEDQGDVRDDLQEGPEPRRDADLLHRGRLEAQRALVEPREHVLGPAEGLDDAQAVGALLDRGGQVARLVLDLPGEPGEQALVAHHQQHDGHRGGEHHQPQRPEHAQQDGGDHPDLQDVDDDEQQPEAEEPAHGRQVAHHPGEELPGLPLPVEGHRQPLQVRVEVHPDRGLDAEGRARDDPAADEHQDGLDHAEGHGERPEGEQAPLVAIGDRAVDDRLGHQRDDDRRAGAQQRHDEHGHPPGQVGPQVAVQPDQGGVLVDAGGRGGEGRRRAQPRGAGTAADLPHRRTPRQPLSRGPWTGRGNRFS